MKLLIFSATVIFFISGPLFASTSMTCQLKTKVGEDGTDRPIMKVLASDTQDLNHTNLIVFQGKEEGAASSFEVKIYMDEVTIRIEDNKNNRTSLLRVDGVDLGKPKLRILSFLSADNPRTKSRELVLQCFGN